MLRVLDFANKLILLVGLSLFLVSIRIDVVMCSDINFWRVVTDQLAMIGWQDLKSR